MYPDGTSVFYPVGGSGNVKAVVTQPDGTKIRVGQDGSQTVISGGLRPPPPADPPFVDNRRPPRPPDVIIVDGRRPPPPPRPPITVTQIFQGGGPGRRWGPDFGPVFPVIPVLAGGVGVVSEVVEAEPPEVTPVVSSRQPVIAAPEPATCRPEDLAAPMELVTAGQKFLNEDKYPEAEDVLKRGLELLKYRCPNHAVAALAWENLALVYEKSGKAIEAADAREQARRIRENLRG